MTNSIKLIVVDLDATLLNDKHELSERNVDVLKQAISQGITVTIATGKTFTSAKSIIEKLGLTAPGIFLQGLAIYKPDGTIVYEKKLDPITARQVITFAEDRGYEVVVYSGSSILMRSVTDKGRELTVKYHEPEPESIGALQNILDEMPVHKLMAVKPGEPRRIKALQWQLDKQMDDKVTLIQLHNIADTLEILPPASGKAVALKALLKQLGVSAEETLAIGDGENDIDMIKMVGVGVAVGNATQSLKDVADHVVASNNDNGVAEAVENFALKQKSLLTTTTPTEASTPPDTTKSEEKAE